MSEQLDPNVKELYRKIYAALKRLNVNDFLALDAGRNSFNSQKDKYNKDKAPDDKIKVEYKCEDFFKFLEAEDIQIADAKEAKNPIYTLENREKYLTDILTSSDNLRYNALTHYAMTGKADIMKTLLDYQVKNTAGQSFRLFGDYIYTTYKFSGEEKGLLHLVITGSGTKEPDLESTPDEKLECVKMLLDKDAKIDHRARLSIAQIKFKGTYPIDLACQLGLTDIVNELKPYSVGLRIGYTISESTCTSKIYRTASRANNSISGVIVAEGGSKRKRRTKNSKKKIRKTRQKR